MPLMTSAEADWERWTRIANRVLISSNFRRDEVDTSLEGQALSSHNEASRRRETQAYSCNVSTARLRLSRRSETISASFINVLFLKGYAAFRAWTRSFSPGFSGVALLILANFFSRLCTPVEQELRLSKTLSTMSRLKDWPSNVSLISMKVLVSPSIEVYVAAMSLSESFQSP